jgi:flagellar hook assembly protein FlgD
VKRAGAAELNAVLGESRVVSVRIYDLKGRLVRKLREGSVPVGYHRIEFNGRTDKGDMLPSGIYVCRMNADGFRKTVKMFMMK